MGSTNIGDNIRKLRKERNLSLLEFANVLNEHVGNPLYSKDSIFRIEKTVAKVPADFVLHASKAFDVSIKRIFFGEQEYTLEELQDNPEHGVSAEKYKYFLAYAKNLMESAEKPITQEMLVKFEQALADMEKVLKNNIEIRAKLDYCTYFIKNHLK